MVCSLLTISLPKLENQPYPPQREVSFLFKNLILENVGITFERENLYSLYRGRVVKKADNLGGFWVDIGSSDGSLAFLPQRETLNPTKVGDYITVQIKRERVENKPPRISQKITLLGKFVNLTFSNFGKVQFTFTAEESFLNKLQNLAEKEKLQIVVKKTDLERVLQEITQLKEILKKILLIKEKEIKTLWEWNKSYSQILECENLPNIYSDSLKFCRQLEGFSKEYPLLEFAKCEVSKKEKLLKQYQISQHLNKILSPRVDFEGGYLLIEETAAAIIVDVNAYGANHLQVNKKAIETLVREIKKRNLGGVILVDLINPKTLKQQKQLLEELKEFFISHLWECKFLGISRTGFLEIVCPKKGKTNIELLSEQCFTCKGIGRIKGATALYLELLEKIKDYKGEDLKVYLPEVYRFLLKILQKEYAGKLIFQPKEKDFFPLVEPF